MNIEINQMLRWCAASLMAASAAVRADISVSPPNPSPGSMVAVSACVRLQRGGTGFDWPSGVIVQIDGKTINNANAYGWCDYPVFFYSAVTTGSVGFGAKAFTTDHWDWEYGASDKRTGPEPMTTVPTVLATVGPGDHTVSIVVEYKDGTRLRESYPLHVPPIADHVLNPQTQGVAGSTGSIHWSAPAGSSFSSAQAPRPGMPASSSTVAQAATGRLAASALVLTPTHGPSGAQVRVSACGFPGAQGAQYDVAVDNMKAFLNLPVAACGSGKFGFGAGTSLPPVTVTVSGARASRHMIEVTNLGSATYIVDP